MTRSSPELKQAWFGSILFHILLGLLLFFIHTAGTLPEPQFVEMTWGSASPALNVSPVVTQEPAAPTAGDQHPSAADDNSVALPTRTNFASPEEVINVPSSSKLNMNEGPSTASLSKKNGIADNREAPASSTNLGSKEDVTGKMSASDSTVTPPIGLGSVGSSIGNNVSFAINWNGGGDRKLLHGDLPKYPAGVNVNAQIKLRVVVQPRGTIKSAAPLQKGNTKLEDAALKEVRLWRFESLQQGQPALDQTCTVTFNFVLK
ncbi:MAG TPA: energy transducer TonB [Bacteroidota bacterium]|nr:energy transducer TonB [Bacteroidota bacterium]